MPQLQSLLSSQGHGHLACITLIVSRGQLSLEMGLFPPVVNASYGYRKKGGRVLSCYLLTLKIKWKPILNLQLSIISAASATTTLIMVVMEFTWCLFSRSDLVVFGGGGGWVDGRVTCLRTFSTTVYIVVYPVARNGDTITVRTPVRTSVYQ